MLASNYVGGDQMTTAQVRGSQRITSNSDRKVYRLQDLVGHGGLAYQDVLPCGGMSIKLLYHL